MLSNKRYADDRVTVEAEVAGGVGRDAVVPTNAGKAEASLVDDRRRKRTHPADSDNLGGIDILGRKEYRYQRRGPVAGGGLRVETGDFVHISRSPIQLDVFLIISDETGLRTLKVIGQHAIRR